MRWVNAAAQFAFCKEIFSGVKVMSNFLEVKVILRKKKVLCAQKCLKA